MDQQIRQMFLSQTTLWGALPTKKLAALARDMRLVELKKFFGGYKSELIIAGGFFIGH